jgi:hypothetical protein
MNANFFEPALLKTAVLFLVFNRPDETKKVFEAIRKAKPPRLYVAADGPREGLADEAKRVEIVRKIVTAVDWSCKVKILFREKNLGCKIAISSGITWFFEQEEQGIILEDDNLPDQSFFVFAEHMLEKYKEDKEIWQICGNNPKNPGLDSSEYFLSKTPSCWGWASWRDRWSNYDVNMNYWHKKSKLTIHDKVPRYVYRDYKNCFKQTKLGLVDTWDYQWTCLILVNNGFVIKPYANLISNIGAIGLNATKPEHWHFVPLGHFLINENKHYKAIFDLDQDLWYYEKYLPPPRWKDLPKRIYSRLKKIIIKV